MNATRADFEDVLFIAAPQGEWETRLIFADWLEENGFHEEAECQRISAMNKRRCFHAFYSREQIERRRMSLDVIPFMRVMYPDRYGKMIEVSEIMCQLGKGSNFEDAVYLGIVFDPPEFVQ